MFRSTTAVRIAPANMRVAHITDMHWLSKKSPSFLEFCSKRIIGYANLYLTGRRNDFSEDVRIAMLQHIKAQNPDIVLITGDFTSTALEDEFVEAKATIKELLGDLPIVAIPGNHDLYSPDAVTSDRMETHLQEWMGTFKDESTLPCYTNEFISIIGMNPCRPNWLNSRGLYPVDQLQTLDNILNNNDTSTTRTSTRQISTLGDWKLQWPVNNEGMRYAPFTILATHYPVIDRDGDRYDLVHRTHGVENNDAFLQVLGKSNVKPSLITHGHDHLGMMGALEVSVTHDNTLYKQEQAKEDTLRSKARALLDSSLINYWRNSKPYLVDTPTTTTNTTYIPISNPGSGGYVNQPPPQSKWHKQAGYCMYTVTPNNNQSNLSTNTSIATGEGYTFDVKHYIHNGADVEANILPYTYVKPL